MKGHRSVIEFLLDHSTVNLRQLTANGEDLLMLAIRTKNYSLVKYFLYATIKNKYSKQLDFNNGDGDFSDEDDEGYIGSSNKQTAVVDPN